MSPEPSHPAPALPRTWRPLGVRIAGVAFSLMLVVLCAVVWFSWSPEIRGRFDWFQRGTLVVLGLGFLSLYLSLVRSRVVATAEGLRVVNGFRTRDFSWPQVLAVNLPPGAPWAVLDLADGTTVSALGIQGSDGTRARTAVRELRAVLEAQGPAEPR
ncbi:PH domain-containing protein [Nocardioides perillae]|uniref:Low molecular weight protein antigen 6 PH domain-containing protein n=1 Tax=Nocardioides perillae TaxID=1119534 RepID=A0A7Y9UMF1_9ACTN|nr:hypothetical protein [Nocardioides perillae]